MTMETKNNIFKEYLGRYLKGSKEEKGEILDHVCFVARLHRKSAIRKLRAVQCREYAEDRRGRSVYYTPDVTAALYDIWQASSEICGELLHPIVAEYVTLFRRERRWKHSDEATGKLLSMSEGTMKRRVASFESARRRQRGLSATKPSELKIIVPIFTGPWADKPPGYGQIDTVVHCGASLLGDLAYTVNYTDVATLWVEPRAQWNKGQEATRASMAVIKQKLSFPWLGAHPDTGSEFINRQVIPWCQAVGIELTRSRPGHKNDNMHVEERNGHVIRKFVGYLRMDCPEAVTALNELYEVLAPYLNHFVPTRKCLDKVRIGSRYKRVYGTPATPYARVLAHPAVSEAVKEKLRLEHARLNPLILKEKIDAKIKNVYDVQKRYGQARI